MGDSKIKILTADGTCRFFYNGILSNSSFETYFPKETKFSWFCKFSKLFQKETLRVATTAIICSALDLSIQETYT